MHIQPIEHGLILNQPTEGYVRTPGLHMSDIYNSLYKGLDPKRFDKGTGPDVIAMDYGSSFEEALEEAVAYYFAKRGTGGSDRPGEYACLASGKIVPVGTPKSIIFSPDHFFYNCVTRLGEFKSTRMTIGPGLRDRKFDKWFCQMMAYGFPLKMRHQRLIALFINGHGKWDWFKVPDVQFKDHPKGWCPPGPLLLAWDIEFKQRELDDNWNTLMRHARKKGMPI